MAETILYGNEELSGKAPRFQYYLNTHNNTSDTRNPDYKNSFISFTYGGHYIEEFGLNVVNASDRRDFTPNNFSNIVTKYDVLDGQFTWGSVVEGWTITLDLATDGMTERQMSQFKNWFRPGVSRQFVLMEHANRAIEARVSAPPTIRMIPFKYSETLKIGDNTAEAITTLYKGEVTIQFYADAPYMYAIKSYFDDNQFSIIDEATNTIAITESAKKIILEDNIPALGMFDTSSTVIIGHDNMSNYDSWKMATTSVRMKTVTNKTVSDIVTNDITTNNNTTNGLRIAPNFEGAGNPRLYYAGDARCAPKISFRMRPILRRSIGDTRNSGWNYIAFPNNHYVDRTSVGYKGIGLRIGNSVIYFTTPGLWTGYNQALEVINDLAENDSETTPAGWAGRTVEEMRMQFIEHVTNYEARAWALTCLAWVQAHKSKNDAYTQNGLHQHSPKNSPLDWITEDQRFVGGSSVTGELRGLMRYLISDTFNPNQRSIGSGNDTYDLGFANNQFLWNFQTGEFKARLTHRYSGITLDDSADWATQVQAMAGRNMNTANFPTKIFEQSVGDMILLGHLYLEDQNTPSDGKITDARTQPIQLINLPSYVKPTTDYRDYVLTDFHIDYPYLYH